MIANSIILAETKTFKAKKISFVLTKPILCHYFFCIIACLVRINASLKGDASFIPNSS